MPADEVAAEILRWSLDRPAWQRVALRPLLRGESISGDVLDELVNVCEGSHGLVPLHPFQPLAESDIAARIDQTEPVSLRYITHHHGVNALAPEQTINFGAKLTVVFGQNAAGKSGYTRVLKSACRSRGPEEILGNVLSSEAPPSASAAIGFRNGAIEDSVPWSPAAIMPACLGSVSVFDAYSAGVYLRDTDVAFRPFGLDVFDKLSTICGDIRSRLEQEMKRLEVPLALPVFAEGTTVRTLLDGLSALTKPEDVQTLANLSAEEKLLLQRLRLKLQDGQVANPTSVAHELTLKAERLESLARHFERLHLSLGAETMRSLKVLAENLNSAREALGAIRDAAFSADTLTGTGGEKWVPMWDAAAKFSHVAYPTSEFPNTEKGARCPLCQQDLNPDAVTRLQHFAKYVSSSAQECVRLAESAYSEAMDKIRAIAIEPADVAFSLKELTADDPGLTTKAGDFLRGAHVVKEGTVRAADEEDNYPEGLDAGPNAEILNFVEQLKVRAADLAASKTSLTDLEDRELSDLEARSQLEPHVPAVLSEIERRQRLSAYRECITETNTQAITRKSTELTKALVTDQLRRTFVEELSLLRFSHLRIELQAAGGARGQLFHKLEFTDAPGMAVARVVSEGESRALSLAAFMTELSTAPSKSTIIFDDPVSSLDHIWRERIAHRLVVEAKNRQVIVFTHDILFLRLLVDGAEREGVVCTNQYLHRNGQPGLCSSSHPWLAMRVSERIGKLREIWHQVEKINRTGSREAYESGARELYGYLREAWEQALVEVLLNDVVERYRPSIQAQRARVLNDITAEDYKLLDDGMTACSRWIRGHDGAAADGTPIPAPVDIKDQIDAIEGWVKAIRKRRG